MSERVPAGPLLDALGVRVSLGPNQQLVDVVIIGKVIDFEAEPRMGTSLVVGSSPSLDWIAQRGMLAAASDLLAADLRGTD